MSELAASAMRSGLSSQPTTSAPPAVSALAATIPEPPRPNTATLLPAKVVTGIMTVSYALLRTPVARATACSRDGAKRHPGPADQRGTAGPGFRCAQPGLQASSRAT